MKTLTESEVPLMHRRAFLIHAGRLIADGVVFVLAVVVLGGCTVGRIISHTVDDDSVPAQYTMAMRPTLVLVKDAPDPFGVHIESDEVAAALENQLTDHKVAPLVASTRLSEARNARPAAFAAMSPAQAGRAVGADQVLYVGISSSSVNTEGPRDMLKGKIVASVSLFDTAGEKVLWPSDGSGGVDVTYETPILRIGDEVTPQTMQRNLNAGLAYKIAELFYNHPADE